MEEIRKTPQRMCIGCRQMKDKKELVRVIRTPEGSAEMDPTGRKNGRGAYLCRDAGCLEKAVRSRALERALKTEITAELLENLRKELTDGGDT